MTHAIVLTLLLQLKEYSARIIGEESFDLLTIELNI
jgi:hypothetical protein